MNFWCCLLSRADLVALDSRLLGLLDLSHDQRVADDLVAVEPDFDVVNTEGRELNANDDVGVAVRQLDCLHVKIDAGFTDDGRVVRCEDAHALGVLAASVGPTGPDGELEEVDGDIHRRDDAKDADQGLNAIGFLPNIFTDDGGLKGWNLTHRSGHHGQIRD